MKTHRKNSIILAFLSTLLLLGIDFVSKRMALKYLMPIGQKNFINGLIRLQYVENRGAAFGILSGRLLPIVLLTPVIVALIIWIYAKSLSNPKFSKFRLICVFFVSGSVGNFIDRVAYGFVVDFLEFEFVDFPVFNIADIYLTLSTLALMILLLFYYKDSDWNFMKEEKEVLYGSENQDNNLNR